MRDEAVRAAFVWPARAAPGFPAGCPDAGDVLGRIAESAEEAGDEVALAVVTSALRATVEDSRDHEAGLRKVRNSLALVADGTDSGRWTASYYGKDLVLTSTDVAEPPPMRFGTGVRHGWAWDRVRLDGGVAQRRAALLSACYEVSMAARLRRDRPDVPEARSGAVLDRVPRLLSPARAASLLAGVLVRPLGGADDAAGSAPGEDPRLPGVPSADGWAATVAGGAATDHYAVTDVHDIEWGTARRADGERLTEGNARQLLPLAEAWSAGSIGTTSVLEEAYRIRLARESELVEHLRTLSDAVRPVGRLHATLGDGLSGLVPDPATLRKAVGAANRRTEGRMHSGAGAARLTSMDVARARERAHFSLHVTKTLKGTGVPQAATHVFGEPLGAEEAAYALDFLAGLARAGAGQAGHHHVLHARRWRDWWLEHLPPAAHRAFARL
ncbi:hypothetical protein GCM10018785_53180 [Streptomyces longispororuber]|uniref:Uncharacterized protein n=1 Tax=Streptomyces longispororuber TaxID=68230 RepID=A0A918ZYV2_9ACTN|nr:hypothetical protein [Streptomyces longispororuber]GHE78383.1 hypothetical protein GCM10018785_53180 [Streptomyces longispororuber]